MDLTKFVVSFGGYYKQRMGYHRRALKISTTLYISRVSFGDHSLLSKWWMTDKKDNAQKFSRIMAEDIQKFLLSQRYINVEVHAVQAVEV